MKPPFYIISDNHFMMQDSKEEQERRKKLFSIFALIKKKGNGTLIIGGDFFDFWFETQYVIPNGYQNLIQELIFSELSFNSVSSSISILFFSSY